MHLIEPCCAQKHLRELRYAIKDGGTTQFEGYGDLSLSELLGPLVTRYNGVEMLIAAPSLPDQAAEIIDKWMRKQWARMDGRGMVDAVNRLTIVARLEKESSHYITAWLKDKPFGDRLVLHDIQQEDTAILLPDFAITGPVNMRYGERFTATATTNAERIAELWKQYVKMKETEEPVSDTEETTEEPVAGATEATEEMPEEKADAVITDASAPAESPEPAEQASDK